MPRKLTMGVSLVQCTGHTSWHVSQDIVRIYEDGAMRIGTAKVMQLASHNQFELKCRGGATLGRRRNLL